MEQVDCVVVGAGAVGLAAARALACAGREVIVLEREGAIGTGISARNSEVIHAGMYYPKDGLKAKLCVRGNRMLRDFAQTHGVPHKPTGKLIVAADAAEEVVLAAILKRGQDNGVVNLRAIPSAEAMAMEPALRCTAALFSPDTGIIDSHAYMLALQGDAEGHGASIAFHAPLIGGQAGEGGIVLEVGGESPVTLAARSLVIAAGLATCPVARLLGLPGVPRERLCKGNYFSLTGRQPFARLVYPVPVAGGLGVHYTLDMGGRGRFGPDVEWISQEDYGVDPSRGDAFYAAIRRYWPDLADGALEPSYCGIRPKIIGPDEPAADFRIASPVPGVVALYGIESPGLTASLAIAEEVAALLPGG